MNSSAVQTMEMDRFPQEQQMRPAPYEGSNRRVTALMPSPLQGQLDLSQAYGRSNYQKFFQSLQANQWSCCLQIESTKNKSRSAILVFRGRVLGCIYGRKDLGHHLFNQAAYGPALRDLASEEHSITAYTLNEELAIAAASLFHGKVLKITEAIDPNTIFDFAHDSLVQFNMPGCIVITGASDLSVCLVYIFAGKIVGVFSDQHGWTEPTYAAVKRHLGANPQVMIQASMLPARNMDEVNQLTFSLSGLTSCGVDNGAKSYSEQGSPNPAFFQPPEKGRLQGPERVAQLKELLPQRNRNWLVSVDLSPHLKKFGSAKKS
jgi:hypothetical protein